jgi:hypothetical protein
MMQQEQPVELQLSSGYMGLPGEHSVTSTYVSQHIELAVIGHLGTIL